MTEHNCPSCDRTFDSRRGLGVHHSSTHGERLPNRQCDHCSERFYSDYQKRYCCEACYDAAVSFAGSDNPNYSDAMAKTDCDNCGTTFEYYPSEKKGCYCSDCVENTEWRHTRQITGSDNPNWSGGGVGEYGPGWQAVRKQALERDGHACVLCGTDADDLGRNPDVHHLVPVRLFVAMPAFTVRDAHTLDNVVSLCPGCHRRAEFGHVSRAELRWRAGIGRAAANCECGVTA